MTRHELKPGWTDYRNEEAFQTIDITPAVRKGRNDITIQMSNGWLAGAISREAYGKNPPLCLRALIECGGKTLAATDGSWQCSTDGPLLAGDIYNGEAYDARRAATEWHGAKVTAEPEMTVVPFEGPEVRIRDERLGWTGDTQIFSRTALYQSDAAQFYRKWMRDMRNSQREDGAYPDIAPFPNFWGYGTAAWGDAGIIVPWTVYDMTGDKAILEENYASMTAYMRD